MNLRRWRWLWAPLALAIEILAGGGFLMLATAWLHSLWWALLPPMPAQAAFVLAGLADALAHVILVAVRSAAYLISRGQ